MSRRVQYRRNSPPGTVSLADHVGNSHASEMAKADELRHRDGIRKVAVDRLERQRSEGGPVFSLKTLSQLRLPQSAKKCLCKPPGQSHFRGSERPKNTRFKRGTPGQSDFYVNGGFDEP